MTRPIVMDVIARDNASKTFRQVANSQTQLAKQTDGLARGNDNLRKSELQLIAAQERYNKVAKDSGASVGKLASAQSSLITAQQRVKKATDDAEQSATKSKRSWSGAATVAAVAGAAVVGLGKSFVEAADNQRKANAQTAAVIKSTGGVAHVTAQQISELSGEISKNTGIQDDNIQAGANMLLTFTNIRNEVGKGNDVFNQATKVVTDMSVALGQDLSKTAIQVGKALNDPIKGISALRRVGVTFSDDQKNVIQQMITTGNVLGAQKVILAELNKEFGGSAEAQATAAAKMGAAWDNFKEAAGNALLPILDKVFGALSGLLEVFGRYTDVIAPAVLAVAGFAAAVWGVNKATAAWVATQKALTTVFGADFVAGLGAAAVAYAPLVVGIGLLTVGTIALNQALGKTGGTSVLGAASQGIKAFTKSLQDSGGVFDSATQKILANTLSQGKFIDKAAAVGISAADLTRGITGNDDAFKSLMDRWNAVKAPGEQVEVSLTRLHEGFQKATAEGLKNADTAVKNKQAQEDLSKAMNVSTDSVGRQKLFLADNNLTVEEAAKKYNDAVAAAHTFTAELGYLSNALAIQSGNAVNARLGALQFTDTLAALGDQVKANSKEFNDNGTSLNTNTVEGRKNYEWALQQIQAINNLAVTQATATGSIKTGTDSLKTNEAALRTSMYQAGFTKKQVDDLITTYGATPSKIMTSIEEQGSAAVLAALGDILNQLHAIADPVWGAKFDFAMNNPSLKRGFARGGSVTGPGTGTSDSIPAWLSSGEYVVNAAATQKHLGLLENINSNKFAFGGQVGRVPQVAGVPQAGGMPGNLNINTTGLASEWTQYGRVLAGALTDAATRAAAQIAKQAAAAGGVPGVSGPASAGVAALQAYALSLFRYYNWPSSEMSSLIALWNGESGWNPAAYNASSGATGIPQSLPASKMASAGADYLTNGNTQIRWGENYISQVYGSPSAAYGAWLSRSPHWYGGGLGPTVFTHPTMIGVGERGPETVSVTPGRYGGSGVVVAPGAITVYAAAGMDAKEVARQAFAELRRWVADEERRAAKGGRA